MPLRERDPDATLALQALVDQAYRNGRYDRTDYAQPDDAEPIRAEAGIRTPDNATSY